MIVKYKNLLPFCGTVWCYDCFKAHVTEWEALSLYVCVTTILSLCPLLPDFFGVGITSETCDKEMWMCATDFQMSLSLVVLLWRYFQSIVCGFEFTSLQVNAHANVMELPKDDGRVERKPPTVTGSLKLTEKVKKLRLLIDDQLLGCLLKHGPCPIFHARINFTKIVNC